MAQIKFSHEYPKLWNQTKAELIEVVIISKEDNLHQDLIEYDTKFKFNISLDHHGNEQSYDERYYKLPNDNLIQLFFVGNKRIPFCTLRRFTKEKYDYYKNLIGEEFNIIRT